jgi:hypothetical protein
VGLVKGLVGMKLIRERHPLGFSKHGVQVGRVAFVFHVWGPEASDRDVHDHRFSFWSLVLRGAMEETLWRMTSGDTCKVTGWHGVGKPAVDTGITCNLQQVVSYQRRRGRIYHRRVSDLHSVAVQQAPLLTFLVKVYPAEPVPYATVVRPLS